MESKMKNKYLFIGEDLSGLKIYEIINKYFGKNYRGWMKAWYDINEDFGAWFPTITETNERPKTEKRWCSNTLSEDKNIIIEIDHDFRIVETPKYDKTRLVFGRIDGQFQFLGVFTRTITKKDSVLIRKHTKIADGVNLDSFELYKKIEI